MQLEYEQAKLFCEKLGVFGNKYLANWFCEKMKTTNKNLHFYVLPEERVTRNDGTQFYTHSIRVEEEFKRLQKSK